MIATVTDEFDLGLGKDVPAMGPFRNLKVNLQGPGAGKIKVGVYIAGKLAQFVSRRPWAKGVASGIALSGSYEVIRNGKTNRNFQKARRTNQSSYYRKRSSNKYYVGKCCRPKCCKHEYRNSTRKYY